VAVALRRPIPRGGRGHGQVRKTRGKLPITDQPLSGSVEAFEAGKQLLVWRQQAGFAAARSGTSAHGVL
jgi:hypothetical protein